MLSCPDTHQRAVCEWGNIVTAGSGTSVLSSCWPIASCAERNSRSPLRMSIPPLSNFGLSHLSMKFWALHSAITSDGRRRLMLALHAKDVAGEKHSQNKTDSLEPPKTVLIYPSG
jgi:hypothetical protein